MGLTAVAAEPEAVQLWAGGPYWATSNLGESEDPSVAVEGNWN